MSCHQQKVVVFGFKGSKKIIVEKNKCSKKMIVEKKESNRDTSVVTGYQ